MGAGLSHNLEVVPSPTVSLGKFEATMEGSKHAHSPTAQDLEASGEILMNC